MYSSRGDDPAIRQAEGTWDDDQVQGLRLSVVAWPVVDHGTPCQQRGPDKHHSRTTRTT